jgi:hypothetical protein
MRRPTKAAGQPNIAPLRTLGSNDRARSINSEKSSRSWAGVAIAFVRI